MSSVLYWIWSQELLGRGTVRAETAAAMYGHPQALFAAPLDELRDSRLFTRQELEQLGRRDLEPAMRILESCRAMGARVLTPDDGEYPEALRHIYSKPAALYVMGEADCLRDRLAIALVGTRRSTSYGRQAADRLSRELASCGVVVVSGLAQGIDTVSHTGALKGGGKTVAVLGCGPDMDYPKANAPLRRLIEQNGAVISEYPPGTQPFPGNFPIRNRIISGLCAGVVVVEGERRSGSLITAGQALVQNRDVFAVPGSIFSPASSGPHWLIHQGAIPVTCTRDILEEYLHMGLDTINTGLMENLPSDYYSGPLPAQAPDAAAAAQPRRTRREAGGIAGRKAAPLFLNAAQQAVYAVIDETPRTVDHITGLTGLEVKSVLASLTQLELYGLVRALPGRRYIAESQ